LNEDEIIIKCEILISIFKNISKFNDQEFLLFYNNSLSNFLEINFNKENKTYRDKLFFTLIEEMAKNSIEEKFYVNLLKNFIKKNILIYDKNNSTSPRESINKVKIEKINYENILENIIDINKIFKYHNENNFMTDFIVYLIKNLYDGFSLSLQSNANNEKNHNEMRTINHQKDNNTNTNFNNNFSHNSNLNISISTKRFFQLIPIRFILNTNFSIIIRINLI